MKNLGEARAFLSQEHRKAWCPQLAAVLSRAGFVEETIYLRFGEVPAGGRSVGNWEIPCMGTFYEAGVSCFRGRKTRQGHYVLEADNLRLKADLVRSAVNHRRPFFLRGRVVGSGQSGEPLLDARTISADPVPADSIVAVEPMSSVLEYWNASRYGEFPDQHPDYLALLGASPTGEGAD